MWPWSVVVLEKCSTKSIGDLGFPIGFYTPMAALGLSSFPISCVEERMEVVVMQQPEDCW